MTHQPLGTRRAVLLVGAGAVVWLGAVLTGRARAPRDRPRPAPRAAVPADCLEAPEVPFEVSSLDDGFFAIVGRYVGTYSVRSDVVDVTLARATLRYRADAASRVPREIVALRVGLGSGDRAGAWNLGDASAPLRIGRTLRPGEELTLPGPLRLRVPTAGAADMGNHWLIFQVEERTPGEDESAGGRTSYAHGPLGLTAGC